MDCPIRTSQSTELLIDYCAETLPLGVAAELERHIATCADCGEFVGSQQQVWSALDTWETEPIAADFDRRLYDRIAETEHRSRWDWLAGKFAWRPVLSLAAACAAVVLTFLVNNAGDRRLPQTSTPAVHQYPARADSIEPEQLERTLEDLEMLNQLSPPAPQSL